MNESYAWDFLIQRIGNPYGVAGLMGNLYVESKINPIDLEGSYARKFGMTSREYTDAVDDGTYTNFVHDSAGYGIAQWTFWSRKEALLKFAQGEGVSIGDLEMQLEYLWDEIQKYKAVVPVLINATSVREASDAVAINYERPKHVEEKYLANRAKYGQEIYDRFATGDETLYSASQVKGMIEGWKSQKISKVDLLRKICPVTVGWSYVWGASGANCTPQNREAYANRSVCPEGEKKEIRAKCPVLNGSQASCSGCEYFPNGFCTLINDCQGYVKWLMKQVGITLSGGGCSSMYRDDSNWEEKGTIDKMPADKMCLVFWQNKNDPKVMDHIAIRTQGDEMYECSGEVKSGNVNNPRITHYAIPKELNGDAPAPVERPTLRKGSRGEYVTLLQTKLIQLGYDLAPYGADGAYGNKTVEAVKEFQRDHGLSADGITGSKTWKAIDESSSEGAGLYTVTIQHVSKRVAEGIIEKYGGNMVKE